MDYIFTSQNYIYVVYEYLIFHSKAKIKLASTGLVDQLAENKKSHLMLLETN
jgi:hypothetical protein